MPNNIKHIKLPDNSKIDINDSRIYIYRDLTGTPAVTTSPYYCARWDVTDESVTEYRDGMVVCVKIPVAGNVSYGTALQINSLGYKPVVYNVNSMIGTRYGAESVIWAVYNSSQTATLYLGNGSQQITGCWQVDDSPFPPLTGNQNRFLSVNFNSTDIEWTEIDVTPITNPEYDYIFGTIDGIFITALYIDDYPNEKIQDIEEEYHCSLYNHIQHICNDFEYAKQCGTNFFSPTTDTIEYEGVIYRVWKAFTKSTGESGDIDAVDLYGLLQDSIKYSDLYPTSMENNINNRVCPFAAVFFMDELYDNPNPDERFTLVHINMTGKYSKPMSATHQLSFSSLYLENYDMEAEGSIFINMIDYNASTIQEFIEKVVQAGDVSQTFEYSGNILQYENSDYQIWSDIQTGLFGGLIPLDTTYQDIYPNTLESDSDNFYTPYCPFEYSWRADQGQVEVGGYDPVTSKWTTVIAIR